MLEERKNVVVTGGTGFVGKKLTQLLLDNGYSVTILSRTAKNIQLEFPMLNGMLKMEQLTNKLF